LCSGILDKLKNSYWYWLASMAAKWFFHQPTNTHCFASTKFHCFPESFGTTPIYCMQNYRLKRRYRATQHVSSGVHPQVCPWLELYKLCRRRTLNQSMWVYWRLPVKWVYTTKMTRGALLYNDFRFQEHHIQCFKAMQHTCRFPNHATNDAVDLARTSTQQM
jgi:hypothetical protein